MIAPSDFKKTLVERSNAMFSPVSNDLRFLLHDTAQEIDDITHDVRDWSGFIAYVLEGLEYFAMASDPDHPEQYELMLRRLNDAIESRLKNGNWQEEGEV
jgi:hypothetical protein